jgi:uncharacterized membrane protein HdeD (DUF308 family)
MVDPFSSTATSDAALRGESSEDVLFRAWWPPLIIGGLNLIAALVVLIAPHTSLLAVALVLGIYLVIAGILVVASATTGAPGRWLVMALGILAIIAGVFVIIRPGSAVHGVRIVFGLYLLISGISYLFAATQETSDRFAAVLRGVLSVIAGLVFLFAPKLGLTALALFVGVYLLVQAAVDVTIAWMLHREESLRAAIAIRDGSPARVPAHERGATH